MKTVIVPVLLRVTISNPFHIESMSISLSASESQRRRRIDFQW